MSIVLTEEEKRQLIAAAEIAADNVCKNIKRLYIESITHLLEGNSEYEFKQELKSISTYEDIQVWMEYQDGWFENLPTIPTKPQP